MDAPCYFITVLPSQEDTQASISSIESASQRQAALPHCTGPGAHKQQSIMLTANGVLFMGIAVLAWHDSACP